MTDTRTILITGHTDGVGRAMATKLADRPAYLSPKPAHVQTSFGDGETRTRTGDTMIFRRSREPVRKS